jgi:hypothetical protein
MGASEDHGSAGGDGSGAADAATGQQQSGTQTGQQGSQSDQGQQSGGSDKGFPENTAIKDMSVDQQAAYYRFQNRQTDSKLAAFKGVTPQDVSTMQQELEALRTKDMTAADKAIKDAEKAARAAADADWRPKLQTAQLRSIASEVLKGEQLNAWLSGVNPAAFANDNGDIDQEKVQSYLTATFGVGGEDQQQQSTNGRQQPPAWGQQSGGAGTPPVPPGEAGRAAVARRHGVKTT